MTGTKAQSKKQMSLYMKICLGIFVFVVVLLIASQLSKKFCDFYVEKLFPLALNTIGRFSSLFPFTVGDILIVITIIAILSGIVMLILSPFFKKRVWRVTKFFWKILLFYLLVIVLILALNLMVLYHTTGLRESTVPEDRKFTNVEYGRVYNYLVDKVNELSKEVNRDENGIPKLDVNLEEEAVKVLGSMSSLYPLLGGYYPKVKYMGFSDIFSQEYVAGYYFPITMEPTINANMNDIMYPTVVTHELIHMKGIIREDEATFLAVLACMGSGSTFFKYSGYLEAFMYMKNYSGFPEMPDYFELHTVDPQVDEDYVFISKDKWKEIEETSVVPTEVVYDIGNKVMDSSLKLNGVEEGIQSYNEMVTLMLYYFLDKE